MSESERFALAARLYTALKRSTGRVIDVLWLLQNEAYAQEVLKLARAADAECTDLAQRLQALLKLTPSRSISPASHSATGAFTATGSHYVRGLR